jgi:hypothetical protein
VPGKQGRPRHARKASHHTAGHPTASDPDSCKGEGGIHPLGYSSPAFFRAFGGTTDCGYQGLKHRLKKLIIIKKVLDRLLDPYQYPDGSQMYYFIRDVIDYVASNLII